MKKHILGLMMIGFLAMYSCNTETDVVTEENVADLILETRGLTNDCFEFVFPVTFQMKDGSELIVTSQEELEALKGENHGNLKLVFPVNIINSAGEPVVVEDHEQMRQILEDCGFVKQGGNGGKHGNGGNHGKGGKGGKMGPNGWAYHNIPKCFEVVFPVTVIFPDETTLEVADKTALQNAWKAWKEANPGTKGGPVFEFPIQVIKDGETDPITINSKEELIALRKSC